MWAHKLQEAVGLGGVGGRRQRSQLSKMAEAEVESWRGTCVSHCEAWDLRKLEKT